jgi:membrane-associated phospholipid phosphatase
MLLLGWAVGKRSTEVDDWFQGFGHSPVRWLLFFTDPRVLAIVLAACVAVALYRQRWRLAAVIVASPAVAVALVQLFKRLFDRHKGSSGSSLAYPSGHTAVMVVVLGMVVLLAGAALWAVLVAVAACLLGMLGQAVTYHYFTDTVGALLLGTAIVCVVAQLDRCQPRVRPTSQPELA